MHKGIEEAILVAGSQKNLAEQLGVTQQFISFAKLRGWVSPSRAKQIEELTGIDRWSMVEPDIINTLND